MDCSQQQIQHDIVSQRPYLLNRKRLLGCGSGGYDRLHLGVRLAFALIFLAVSIQIFIGSRLHPVPLK